MGGPGRVEESSFHRYVPRVASDWDLTGPRHRVVDGTLVFLDISGFTRLTERLSARGRVGAEELTIVLDHVFGAMLVRAYARGGSLLKFGGDALLLLFEGSDHALQACAAGVEMRSALRESADLRTSVGRISLRMTVGVRSGPVDLFMVGSSHRELVVCGPAATEVVAVESSAEPGEIVVSESTMNLVPGLVGSSNGTGWLLRRRSIPVVESGPVERDLHGDEYLSSFIPRGLRRQLGSGLRGAEHKIASVAFVAFKGVTAIAAESGPASLAEELDHFIRSVQEQVDTEGITFLSTDADTDGGKLIITSGVPDSLVDAEGRLLRATRAILGTKTALTVKAGAMTGHLFVAEAGTPFRAAYTVMGDIVNTAARLMAAAPPGHLFASPETLRLSATVFRTTPLVPIVAKGKQHGVVALDVFEETGRSETTVSELLPFVGRGDELNRIADLLQGAGVLTVTGEPGIGKSRLVAEALATTARRTFTIRGEPAGASNPYWALRDPLRALLGIPRTTQETMVRDLASAITKLLPTHAQWLPLFGDATHIEVPATSETEALEAHNRPDKIASVLADLLEAEFGHTLVVRAEDLHWLDEASFGLLERLSDQAETRGWTILATGQRGEDEGPVLGTEWPLEPLPPMEARRALDTATAKVPLRPDIAAAVIARAEGNPLFLTELLAYTQTAADPSLLPTTLAGVASIQVDRLPPLTRQLLRHASVLGRSFRIVVLDRLLAPEPFGLSDETRADLSAFLEQDGTDRLRFRSAVTHDAAYQGLPFAKRRELHARAGVVIENLAGDHPEAVAEFLADHFAAARVDDKAWRYTRIAADRAFLTYANQTAESHYRSALEAGRRLGVADAELSRTWMALGDALQRQAKFPQARTAYSEALRKSGQDPLERATAFLSRAQTWLQVGSIRNAKRAITTAKRELGGSTGRGAQVALGRVESFAAAIAMTEDAPTRALASATRAREIGEKVEDPETLSRAYTVLDWAHAMNGTDGEVDFGERAVAILEDLHRLERAADVMNNKGGAAYLDGDWTAAIDWYRRSIDASRRAGSDLDAALGEANVIELLVAQRRWLEARPLLDQVRRTLVSLDAAVYLPFVDLQLGRLHLGSGDLEGATDVLTAVRDAATADGDPFGALEASIPLTLATAEKDPAAALALLETAVATAGDLGDYLAPAIALARASIRCALGETSTAKEIAEQGLAIAEEREAPLAELQLLELLLTIDPDAVPPGAEARRNTLIDRLGVAT